MESKIVIKRRKQQSISRTDKFQANLEEWVGYWRANPHRFITDYLGLKLYDFQKILIYQMNFYPKFIFIASRGLAKSTLALIFAIQRCILYPGQKIVVVAPTKKQSSRFIKKIYDLKRHRPNLEAEIAPNGIKTRDDESSILFKNGSEIITMPYSENALGNRCNILIVDEFVRTEKEVITRVFVPMLTDTRKPEYRELTKKQLDEMPEEPQRQLYLSSIRRADEWSYKYFKDYVRFMTKDDMTYTTVALPYNFGVKNRFINKDTVEQSFKENTESIEMLLAEYKCQPERSSGNSFYKYSDIEKHMELEKCLVAMSDIEYMNYKNRRHEYPFYLQKKSNEIRILSMDVALVESAKNDDTAFWILRLIPDGNRYIRHFIYAESMHGQHAILQRKRAKQLFYEMECDYFLIDGNGMGQGVFDILAEEVEDEMRGETYPGWTVMNPDDVDNHKRQMSVNPNAVPVVWCVKTGIADKSNMLVHSREILPTGLVGFLTDDTDAIEYYVKNHDYYKIEDEDLRRRMLNPYVQTKRFVYEAINLEQTVVQGRISAKEKPGRRKDRVMSYAYALGLALRLEQDLSKTQEFDLLEWIRNG